MNPLYDHRLLTLATLVETGSFTATAERLFISQPAVSQQITALENELNLELVHRRGKRIQVTKAAEHLTNYLHRESLNADQLLEQLRGAEPVPLRLGATLSLAEFMLPELLGELVDAGHQVKIHTANTDQLLQAIDDGTIDLALVEGNFHKEAYGVLPLGTAAFGPVTAQTHGPRDWEAAFNTPLYLRETGSGTRVILEGWLATHNYSVNDFSRVIEVDNPTTIIKLLLQGRGISFMYLPLVEELIRDGKLRELTLPGFVVNHPLTMVYRKNSVAESQYQQVAKFLTSYHEGSKKKHLGRKS
ncbi:transcriptional regulator [Limosilactobacillus fermentum]|uniref:LysR family transcriptional regulator n=1 Tax=Limosilactobacillus fermentum TaxID=1613 RepID=UPI000B4C849C|nr:LysR family transcriptional regulator [Limosilactobacillus fermentum]OWP35763.1 transcriptional regulator [Limosilactobacillus fermentum]